MGESIHQRKNEIVPRDNQRQTINNNKMSNTFESATDNEEEVLATPEKDNINLKNPTREKEGQDEVMDEIRKLKRMIHRLQVQVTSLSKLVNVSIAHFA